ncbi:hypothetical protein [Anaerococcus cruorum]|uniref:hypothetical protein n=1 Tax=Anaerococcus sp. WGS1596 TaxID=3366806 RepID=UPI00372D3AE7
MNKNKLENFNDKENKVEKISLEELTGSLLIEARSQLNKASTIKVPRNELSNLGTIAALLSPSLESISASNMNQPLYRIKNFRMNDELVSYKSGGFAPYYKGGGKGAMAQLEKVDFPIQPDPIIMLMAVALYSFEKDLKEISKTQKEILNFLEVAKKSEIISNLETVMDYAQKYKYNWDNESILNSYHQRVLEIKDSSSRNILFYQDKIKSIVKRKKSFVTSNKVKSALEDLENHFKYYRLSLYTYSLASFLEIILSQNFGEEYVAYIKNNIEKMSKEYRDLFGDSSMLLEDMGKSSIDTNIKKGIGTAGKKVGDFTDNIPLVKKSSISKNIVKSKNKKIGNRDQNLKTFSVLSNPGTGPITRLMDDIIKIYNNTEDIIIDNNNIYLVSDKIN